MSLNNLRHSTTNHRKLTKECCSDHLDAENPSQDQEADSELTGEGPPKQKKKRAAPKKAAKVKKELVKKEEESDADDGTM